MGLGMRLGGSVEGEGGRKQDPVAPPPIPAVAPSPLPFLATVFRFGTGVNDRTAEWGGGGSDGGRPDDALAATCCEGGGLNN